MPTQPEHLWLPYTQMQTAASPLAVASTTSCRIKLADGRELIDGISSWWSACHGYNHPHIIESVQAQLNTMPHVMLAGLTHEPAAMLAKRLSHITPLGLNHVFFSDSGSVAVEVALKIALQYWHNVGKPKKDRFICFKDGYHGDTLGAMSVSDPEKSLHKAFKNSVIKQYVIDIPTDEYGFAEFDSLLASFHGNIAGLIIEPLVQGAGGMIFHSPDVLAEIHRITKKYDVLFIADEIATGFGRTGSMFACNEAGISPDILCLGKALTAGTMSMGATLVQDEVYNAFLNDSRDFAFMHGPTFMANALACAAANASLDLFFPPYETAVALPDYSPMKNVERIENQLASELAACENLPNVVDVRIKGAIGVVQVDTSKVDIYGLRKTFPEMGVWLRPFKDVIYIMPPFVISEEELTVLTQAVIRELK